MLPAPSRLWSSGPGKPDTLARCSVFRDDPECYTTTLEHVRAVGAAELRKTARQWLSDGVYVLDVLSFGELAAAASGAVRPAVTRIRTLPGGGGGPTLWEGRGPPAVLELLNLDEVIDTAQRLEPLPAATARLANLVAAPEPELDPVVEVISYDPALTARLLRYANSAASGSRHEISSVRAAVVRLGFGVVLSVTMASAVRRRLRVPLPQYGLAEGDLWRHSVASAVMAERLTDALARPVPPEAFSAALLHDIGKLVLADYLDDEVRGFLERAESEGGRSRLDAESELLGVHHGELGGLIAQHWNLPRNMIEGIVFHHDPGAGGNAVCDVVHAANVLAKVVDHGPLVDDDVPLDEILERLDATAIERLGLSDAALTQTAVLASERLSELMTHYGG